MNIYDGCIDNSEIIYHMPTISWDEQLDAKRLEKEKLGFKVVFIFYGNSFTNAARVVLYNKTDDLPECIRNYRHKYVRLNGHWVIESQLGICDLCGEYKLLTCLCEDGLICDDCGDKEEF